MLSGSAVQQAVIPVVTGPEYFQAGDAITIAEVKATSVDLKAGDRVTVKGHYALTSKSKAELLLSATNTKSPSSATTQSEQKKNILSGQGEFELSIMLQYDGCLHVTFYSVPDGKPFGGVYFGTASQMDEAKQFNVPDWYTAK